MPLPAMVIDNSATAMGMPASFNIPQTLPTERLRKPSLGGSDSFAELAAAVENLSLRHETLIARIDRHHIQLVEKLNVSMLASEESMKCLSLSRALSGFSKPGRTGTTPEPAHEKPSDNCAKPVKTGPPAHEGFSRHTTPTNRSGSLASVMKGISAKPGDVGKANSGGGPAPGPDTTVSREISKIFAASSVASWWTHHTPYGLLSRIVHARLFEIVSGGIIFVNMVALFVQLQLQSCETRSSMVQSEEDCAWTSVGIVFDFLEYAFNIWYLGELILRIRVFRWHFFTDRLNVLDAGVVCMAFFQHAVANLHFVGFAPLRLLRIMRALRVIRVVRLLLAFRELHIMLQTLSASFYSLQWSMCLVCAIVWSSGLLVMQVVDPFIQDSSRDLDLREELYMGYGTPLRAGYSMFVATFSSAWVPTANQMIEHVHPLFAVFWVLYIVAVNFAIMRVVAALFLKQTMDVASRDAERRAMERQKDKQKFASTLHQLFIRYDTSGDGNISREEFDRMIDSKGVLRAFETLGLDYDEVCALFEVMSSDDGVADYEELLGGALLMKSSARTFDAIRIMHQLGSLEKSLHCIESRLGLEEPSAHGNEDYDATVAAVSS